MACLLKEYEGKAYRLNGVLSLKCLALQVVEDNFILRTSEETDDYKPEIFERKSTLLVKLSEAVFKECYELLIDFPYFSTPEFLRLKVERFEDFFFEPQCKFFNNVQTFGDKDLIHCPYKYHYTNRHCPYKALNFMGLEFHDLDIFNQFISYKIVIFALKYREFFDAPYISDAEYDLRVLNLEKKIRKFWRQCKRLETWLTDYTLKYKYCESD